jgi:hypothetical protein
MWCINLQLYPFALKCDVCLLSSVLLMWCLSIKILTATECTLNTQFDWFSTWQWLHCWWQVLAWKSGDVSCSPCWKQMSSAHCKPNNNKMTDWRDCMDSPESFPPPLTVPCLQQLVVKHHLDPKMNSSLANVVLHWQFLLRGMENNLHPFLEETHYCSHRKL